MIPASGYDDCWCMGRAQSVHSDCNLKNMFVFGLGMYFSNHDTSTVHKILIVNYPPYTSKSLPYVRK